MVKQFDDANCKYGAPMGRRDDGYLETTIPRSVRLFRVKLDSGGYDDGGAYWGIGAPLWCAIDDDGNRQFVRAYSRARAALELNIPDNALKRPIGADALHLGIAVLDGRAPWPDDKRPRAAIIEWLRGTGRYFG